MYKWQHPRDTLFLNVFYILKIKKTTTTSFLFSDNHNYLGDYGILFDFDSFLGGKLNYNMLFSGESALFALFPELFLTENSCFYRLLFNWDELYLVIASNFLALSIWHTCQQKKSCVLSYNVNEAY